MREILIAIRTNQAKLIGERKWVKDSAHQVYEFEDRFFLIVIYDFQDKWLIDDTLIEIEENEIIQYVNLIK